MVFPFNHKPADAFDGQGQAGVTVQSNFSIKTGHESQAARPVAVTFSGTSAKSGRIETGLHARLQSCFQFCDLLFDRFDFSLQVLQILLHSGQTLGPAGKAAMKAMSMNGTTMRMPVLTAAIVPVVTMHAPFAAAIMMVPALVVTASARILVFMTAAAATWMFAMHVPHLLL
jgi:hypothetical protein